MTIAYANLVGGNDGLVFDGGGYINQNGRPMLEDPRNRFGGWHPDVTLFLFGDGSVKAISNDYSPNVLQRLGSRNDGNTAP